MSVEQVVLTRYASELVDKTLSYYISNHLGIPSGDIYFHSPDHIFVNDRTETTNNRQQTRYPCISIETEDMELKKLNELVQEYFVSTTATGLVNYFVSDYECYNYYCLSVYTSTKREHRRMKEKMINFFNTYDIGLEMVEDSLPNSVKETFAMIMDKPVEDYQEDTPYMSCFKFFTIYRLYKEKSAYLLYDYILSGTVTDGMNQEGLFTVSGSLF